MGTLYVVATPIGNVEDLSPRARRVLGEVSLVASEDTRRTGMLLKRLGIDRPQISYHAFNERSRIESILECLATGDVALVSDAGTPAISDPGAMLVRAVIEAGIDVRTIPGPSSLTAAMAISGFADGPSIFLGFLPRAFGERRKVLELALDTGFAIYCFESPRRVTKTMSELATLDPDREVVIFRELTKRFEEVIRGSAGTLARDLETEEHLRGEVVIGIAGASRVNRAGATEEEMVRERLRSGMTVSQVAREVAALSSKSRSEIYDLALRMRRQRSEDGDQPD